MEKELFKLQMFMIEDGAEFLQLDGRRYALCIKYIDYGKQIILEIIFFGVEAFKCTHFRAFESSAQDVYNCLIDFGDTEWLTTAKQILEKNWTESRDISHFGIRFGDGPFYEFLAQKYEIKKTELVIA
jgi:hypothetical protein